ncbi:MAG TPA: TonB-dependent receptor [Candidatus Sulfotelmatobacter sp.]|nr:TonB-dependent receptor [Candidatus Sulfotelmatobacter sp.]
MSNLRKLALVLCAVVAGLNLVGYVEAQQITGSIRGTVLDPSGAIVQAATVTAKQTETGLTRVAITDRQGEYVLVELPIGHYQLEVQAKGFQKYLQQGISLDVNETATVSIHLKLGSETQQVEVSANAALVQSTVSSLGQTVMEDEILDLPLDGRNFSQLGTLQPGVVPLTPGLLEAGGPAREGQAYAVDGQRPESNNFLIDGADNVNAVDAGFVLKPPIDAIAEFRILTHNANAEFGRNTGSTTNIVTRSGSNSFHGAAWEFLRNDAMDSSDYFTRSVQPLKQNQFGATFGGPIVKNKTFFFGYYEGFRNRQGETVPATVPSAEERQGNFAEECTRLNATFDQTTGFCSNPNGQLTFFGTQVPFNQMTLFTPIDPTATNVLPLFPLPNVGENGFIATQTLSENNDQFGLRLDHYLSSADTFNFRYMYSSGPTTDPLSTAGANVPGFPVGQDDRAQNFVAQETHIFSATTIGVARFSYLRNKFLLDQHINHTPASDFGFTYQPTLPSAAGPPFIQIGGYASVGDPITGPRNTFQNTFDLSGSLSWIHGRHEFKFGGGYRRDQINGLQGIATNGFFVFAGIPSFANFLYNDGFANFLSGNPVVFLQGGGDFAREIRDRAVDAYAQDTYKVNSRVTLNLGLRYELPFPSTENKNRVNLFVPGVQSRVLPNAPAGLLYPGDPGVPAGLIATQKTAFAPRVGVAWDPRGDSKTVISAAYGIFYEPFYNGEGGPLQDPVSAPPYLKTLQLGFPINSFADPYTTPDPFAQAFPEPMTLLVVARDLHLPYAQDWNLNIQRSFGQDWLLQVGYVGTTGVRLPRFIEGDPAVFVPGLSNSAAFCAPQSPPCLISTENNVNNRRLYSGCTLAPNSPNCIYSSVGEIAGIANSSYNALEASLRKRFSHGLSFLASYTWSHSIDDVSSFNITGSAAQDVAGENDLAQNPFDLAAERGRSMFDSRHRFVLSYQWSLPFLQHSSSWYGHVFGNWQLNGIVTAMSGGPFTVYDSSDPSLQGQAPEITGFSANRPNLIGNPNSGPRTPREWFNVSAFQQLQPDPLGRFEVFGNEGRNVVQGPGYVNWDASAFKNIRLTESKELQFRGELFNLLNHTNFRLPVSDIESPTFGRIQSDVGPRVIQVALKFLF